MHNNSVLERSMLTCWQHALLSMGLPLAEMLGLVRLQHMMQCCVGHCRCVHIHHGSMDFLEEGKLLINSQSITHL